MLYYPQLTSGSVCQYPVLCSTSTRTICNVLSSGETIRMSDVAAATVRWQLHYKGLSDSECASINQLFAATEGRLNTFTFLDPTDNLLMWSEDWTQSVWVTDPLLEISIGLSDPEGGTGAVQLTNTGQAVQQAAQQVAAASWFQYCFSIYLRSDSPCMIQLLLSCAGQQIVNPVAVGSAWARFIVSGSLSSAQDGAFNVGVALPPGVRVEVFGPQLEAQQAPGAYKRNTNQSGIYPETRFDDDSLSITAEAVNQSSCVVKLVTVLPPSAI